MEPFKTHTGIIAILDRGNIDTDQIISKEFLKSIQRTGFGDHLFAHWRYLDDGSKNPNFELNRPEFEKASILITGNNFGCGSSREHAVWALVQFGFKVILAPRKKMGNDFVPAFADIFKNNSIKNGLLTLELPENDILAMKTIVNKTGKTRGTLDLVNQKMILHAADEEHPFAFEIEANLKQKLMEGLDEIGQTFKYWDQILAFEKSHSDQMAWES